MLSSLRRYLHTTLVIRCTCSLKYSCNGAELTSDLNHHLTGSTSYSLHGQTTEQECRHSTNKGTDQHLWIHQCHLEELHKVWHSGIRRIESIAGSIKELLTFVESTYHGNLYFLYIRSKQCQRSQCCRTYSKALTRGCRCVTKSIESIRTMTYLFTKTTHLCIATCIVSYRSISIGSKCDSER